MEQARHFYKDILELEISKEFDTFILFQNGFSIHDGKIYASYIKEEFQKQQECHTVFYFSSTDIFKTQQRLRELNVTFIHEMIKQPWGEYCIRCYDPDFHVIEIGEVR
jgi:predicted enzyme related to lactoylglutathione lyase